MKHVILTLSLLLSFAGPVMAAQAPIADDPNDVTTSYGRAYQNQKKKLGACAATAQGDASAPQLIHADAAVNKESTLQRALRSKSTI